MSISTSRVSIVAVLTALAALTLGGPATAEPGKGAVVVRFQDQMGFFIADPKSGLLSFHGTEATFAEICSGAPFSFDDLDIQMIVNPAGPLHFLFTASDHHVVIYPSTSLPDPNHIGPEDCPILVALPVIASGTARLVRTDNDITVAGPGANAFGWMCNGVLTETATGLPIQYHEVARALVLPGSSELRELQITIQLK